MEVDYDRNADEILAARGPDGLRKEADRVGESYVLFADGVAKTIREVVETGPAESERLLPEEKGKVARYRALRRRIETLDESEP